MPLPYHEIGNDDIKASKYVSETLQRSIKQLNSAEITEEESEKTQAGTDSAYAEVIRLGKSVELDLKRIKPFVESFIRTPPPPIMSSPPRPTGYIGARELNTDLTKSVDKLHMIGVHLNEISIEYLSANKVAALKKMMEKFFKDKELIKRAIGISYKDLSQRIEPESVVILETIVAEIEGLGPRVQALLDVENVKLPPTTDPKPESQQLSGSGICFSNFPMKRFL